MFCDLVGSTALTARLDPEDIRQVIRAYQLAYARDPDVNEASQGRAFVERHGLSAFCRVLFNSNEFVQVD